MPFKFRKGGATRYANRGKAGKRKASYDGSSKYKRFKYPGISALLTAMLKRKSPGSTRRKSGRYGSKIKSVLKVNHKVYGQKNFQRKVMMAVSPVRMRVTGALRLEGINSGQSFASESWLQGRDNGTNTGLQTLFANTNGISQNAKERLYVVRNAMHFRVASSSNVIVNLTIYDIISREDVVYTDPDASPAYAFDNGMADLGNISPNQVGVSPFLCRRFTAKFKVVGTKKITLNPGEIHHHIVKVNHNWMVPYTRCQSANSVANMRGRTRHCLFVIEGSPAHQAADATQVGLGKTAVDICWDYKVECKYISDSSVQNVTLTNGVNPMKTLPDGQVFNDDAGQEEMIQT